MKVYKTLSAEEKARRLEIVAQLYLSWLSVKKPMSALMEDCTNNFPEMESAFKGQEE